MYEMKKNVVFAIFSFFLFHFFLLFFFIFFCFFFSSKDNFGYGESVLSMVFALNGVAVGALQLLGMRHLVRLLGKHMMLITGNVFLAMGMVGVAFSRNPAIHFAVRVGEKKKKQKKTV